MHRRTAVAAAAVLGLLALGVVLGVGLGADGGGTLSEAWVSDTARDTLGNHHAPAVGRLEDGQVVIVAPVNAPGSVGDCALVAFYPNRTVAWRATTPPEACNIHAFGDPAIADLDGDGDREVFVATTEERVHAYDLRTGTEAFNRSLGGWGYSAPVVADLAPAPGRELVVADLTSEVAVFGADGDPLWRRPITGTVAPIYVRDVDADGDREVVVAEGRNLTLFGPSGDRERRVGLGGSITWLTVGQADGDAALEVVAAQSNGRVVAVDGGTGERAWTRDYTTMAAVYAFGDGDGDGQAEVYAVAQDGTLRAIDASDGAEEWTTTLTTASVPMMPPPALGDLDGDGAPELVAVSKDGIVAVVNPRTGAIVDSYERDVPIWMRPTLADLDGEPGQEVLVTYGDGRVVALRFEGGS